MKSFRSSRGECRASVHNMNEVRWEKLAPSYASEPNPISSQLVVARYHYEQSAWRPRKAQHSSSAEQSRSACATWVLCCHSGSPEVPKARVRFNTINILLSTRYVSFGELVFARACLAAMIARAADARPTAAALRALLCENASGYRQCMALYRTGLQDQPQH